MWIWDIIYVIVANFRYDLYNLANGRRVKLQPDLEKLLKQLGGGPGAPQFPPGRVSKTFKDKGSAAEYTSVVKCVR